MSVYLEKSLKNLRKSLLPREKWNDTVLKLRFENWLKKKEYLSTDGGLSSSMRMEHPAFHSQKIFNCFHGFFGNALPKVVVVGKMDLKGSQKSNPHQITLVNEPLKITHPATIPIPTLQSSLEGSDSELRCTSCRLRIYLHMVFFSELSQLEKKWPVRWRIHPQEIHFRKKNPTGPVEHVFGCILFLMGQAWHDNRGSCLCLSINTSDRLPPTPRACNIPTYPYLLSQKSHYLECNRC